MTVYEIRVRGHIGAEWSEWLNGFQVSPEANGETVLSGPVPDQAALFGLLTKVRDLGLPLLAVAAQPHPPTADGGPAGSRHLARRRRSD